MDNLVAIKHGNHLAKGGLLTAIGSAAILVAAIAVRTSTKARAISLRSLLELLTR